MRVRYLVRFDDICPTMNRRVWDWIEPILKDAGVQPLMAVVPENRDPRLEIDEPDPQFWNRVRVWQQRGWSIGLHGFEHRYVTTSSGIVGRNPYSEFAGLGEEEQRQKLTAALAIFASEGVHADAWVAPAHSFDATTVRLLAELGVDSISDGYALSPYVSDGMLWVPQQLGKFRRMPAGTWTVCLHINYWGPREIAQLRDDLRRFGDRLVSLSNLKRQYGTRPRSLPDGLFDACFRKLRAARGAGW